MATKARENHREDVVGRANVEDTPELLAYYDQLEKLEAGALWTVANKIEPWAPKSSSVPVLWRYQDLRAHVLRSVELVSPEKAGRRVIYLNNPGRREHAAAVGWLYSGLQVMHPGEVATAHAHSASALRFIMEGEGAYTIVDGHKMTLGANDFVLTPNGTWHEHGVEATGSACIWQDGLDIPLVNALEAKDPYLRGHSARVADLSAMVASEIGLSDEQVETIRTGGRLHDIGKIGIREEILNKQGPLTDDEFEHVKLHPVTGSDILAPLSHLGQVINFVRSHHERWDGRGYPDGLAADQIPLGARIIGTVEIYDALTTSRPYQEKMTPELAVERLQDLVGTVVDPEVQRALRRVVAKREALVFLDDQRG